MQILALIEQATMLIGSPLIASMSQLTPHTTG